MKVSCMLGFDLILKGSVISQTLLEICCFSALHTVIKLNVYVSN